jgi:hypothetical protein
VRALRACATSLLAVRTRRADKSAGCGTANASASRASGVHSPTRTLSQCVRAYHCSTSRVSGASRRTNRSILARMPLTRSRPRSSRRVARSGPTAPASTTSAFALARTRPTRRPGLPLCARSARALRGAGTTFSRLIRLGPPGTLVPAWERVLRRESPPGCPAASREADR